MKQCFLGLIITLSTCLYAVNDPVAEQQIVSALKKWPQDFNKKNVPGVCELFAPNLIAIYEGIPERNYEEICRQLSAVLSDPNKSFHYETPEIEQVLIDNEMAVVRLVWKLKITDKQTAQVTSIREKGMDIFQRQKDGSWKIAISYAYPEMEG
jgi:ketosteroid isomerase-like protein